MRAEKAGEHLKSWWIFGGGVVVGMILAPTLMMVNMSLFPSKMIPYIDYDEFLAKLGDGNVRQITIDDWRIRGELADGSEFNTCPSPAREVLELAREKGVIVNR